MDTESPEDKATEGEKTTEAVKAPEAEKSPEKIVLINGNTTPEKDESSPPDATVIVTSVPVEKDSNEAIQTLSLPEEKTASNCEATSAVSVMTADQQVHLTINNDQSIVSVEVTPKPTEPKTGESSEKESEKDALKEDATPSEASGSGETPVVVMSSPTKIPATSDAVEKAAQKRMEKMLKLTEPDPIMIDSEERIRPVAKVLIEVGLKLTRKTVLSQLIRQHKRMRKPALAENSEEAEMKEEGASEVEDADFEKVKKAYDELLKLNEPFSMENKFKCGSCTFSVDTANALHYHQEYAHDTEVAFFNCALCDFLSRHSPQFLDHMQMTHKRRGRLFLKPQIFSCSQCQFETNIVVTAERHKEKCAMVLRTRCLQPTVNDRDFPVFSARPQKKTPAPAPVQPKAKPQSTPPPMMGRMTIAPKTRAPTPTSQRKPVPTGPAIPANQNQRMSGSFTLRGNTPPASTHKSAMAVAALGQQNTKMIGHSNNDPVLRMNNKLFVLRTVMSQQYLVPVYGISQLPNFIPLPAVDSQTFGPRVVSAVAPTPSPTVAPAAAPPRFAPPTIIVQPESEAQAMSKAAKTKLDPMRSERDVAMQRSSDAGDFAVCEICGGYLKDRANLLLHFQFAHKVNLQPDVFLKRKVGPILCQHCSADPQFFWTYQGLHKHMLSAHQSVMGSQAASLKPNNKSKESLKITYDEIKNGQCVYCLQKFSRSIQPDSFWVHMMLHGIVPSSVLRLNKCCACGFERDDADKMVLHVRTKHPLIFSRVTKQQLEAERKIPSGAASSSNAASRGDALIKVFRCNHCEYQHTDRDNIRKHVSTSHLFKCSRCRQRFDTRDAMHKHYNKVHANEKDKCPICQAQVRCGRPFVRHVKSSHTRNCSVVLPRMRKADVRARQDEVDAILEKAPKSKNDGRKKRKLGGPASARNKNGAAVGEQTGSDSVIMLESDSAPPKKRTRLDQQQTTITSGAASSSKPSTVIQIDSSSASAPEKSAPINKDVAKRTSTSSAKPASKKEVLRVNGEQIVVELNNSEEDTTSRKPDDVTSANQSDTRRRGRSKKRGSDGKEKPKTPVISLDTSHESTPDSD